DPGEGKQNGDNGGADRDALVRRPARAVRGQRRGGEAFPHQWTCDPRPEKKATMPFAAPRPRAAPAATTAPFFPLASAWCPPVWWPQAHTPSETARAPTTAMIPNMLMLLTTFFSTARPGNPPPLGVIPGS